MVNVPGITLVVKHFVAQVQLIMDIKSEKQFVLIFNFHFFALILHTFRNFAPLCENLKFCTEIVRHKIANFCGH